MMTVTSQRKAEKKNSCFFERNHARAKAYVALLRPGQRGQIMRDFVKREKHGDTRLLFSVAHRPGDIYEIRRWFWDADRKTFMGGTVYIGFDESNHPFALSREEAFLSLTAPLIAQNVAADDRPARPKRTPRMLPSDIAFS